MKSLGIVPKLGGKDVYGIWSVFTEKIFLFRCSEFDFFNFHKRGCSAGKSNKMKSRTFHFIRHHAVVYNLLAILKLLSPESKLWVKIEKVKSSTPKKSIFSRPDDFQKNSKNHLILQQGLFKKLSRQKLTGQ